MVDITLCANFEFCSLKETCVRAFNRNASKYQSYSKFFREIGNCESYIPINVPKKKKKSVDLCKMKSALIKKAQDLVDGKSSKDAGSFAKQVIRYFNLEKKKGGCKCQ